MAIMNPDPEAGGLIRREAKFCADALDCLSETLFRLEDRLTPILSPEMITNELADTPAPAACSQVAATLGAHTSTVLSLRYRVERLIERVEA